MCLQGGYEVSITQVIDVRYNKHIQDTVIFRYQNIWQREILVNRLNFPIDENLNRWNGMIGSCDFMDAMINMHERVCKMRHAPKWRLKKFTFLM